ncbi:MAG: hypothetical protein A2033_01075 [Bacteroidetes bacterium GWA2_31_9]|nr:MAG: hypothetical protein A2033_01075 [Bacteroidetes bacterium GWA2_31_9]
MPKLNEDIKQKIKQLPKPELEKLVLKIASKNKEFYDYIYVTYIDQKTGEYDLFEAAKNDINLLFMKRYKGFSEELQMANMISACVKRINEFSKICKKKNLEADLLLYVLDDVFSVSSKMFGTCFTAFDNRVGLLLKRLITLVTKKLHPDFIVNYTEKINIYLTQLHSTSDHNDVIYNMPEFI